ncbi:MAG: ATP-binding protein [Candidatus Aenigmarchaeota archaeon]
MLGKISGSVTTKNFTFKAEARVKKLQYITVKDFEGRWILSYVDSITKYPNRTVGKAKVIGFRDSRGFLKPLTVPFEPETPVYTADEDLIRHTLGLKDEGLYVGLLGGYKIQVNLPVKHLITKHVAILAKTGVGKSYAAGVLLEELAEKGTPVVIIDPHGEYRTLAEKNKKENEISQMEGFGIEPKSYKNCVRIFDLGLQNPVKLDSKLTTDEIFEMLPAKVSSAQRGLLYSAIKNLEGKDYTLRDITEEVDSIESNVKWNLISMLELLENTKLFSANPTKPKDLVKRGKVTIIDLKEANPEIQQIVVLKIAKELFTARKRGEIPEFFFLMEEAHNFCPERGLGEVASSKILRIIASEGRKFGMGLGIISQRPAKVDKNVLSQCSTQIILKVTNPNDIKAIMESVEGVEFGTREEIKDLPVGVAMIVGATEQPLFVDVRVRRSEHGGEVIKAMERKVSIENRILMFAPRFFEEDVKKSFKGIEEMVFLNYPVWKIFGVYRGEEVEFYVDGITGEIVFEKDDSIEYSKGIRSLLELPPSQRSILLYLTKNKYATIEKLSNDLKILLSSAHANLKSLAKKKLVTSDGYMFRGAFEINVPLEPSLLKMDSKIIEKEMEGEKLDFMVSPDFVRKIGEIWEMRILEVKPVYYPYWMVTHKNSKYLINGLNNRLEIEKSKIIRGLL